MLRPSLYCFVSILTTLSDIHALFLFWPHSVTCMLCFYSDHTQWHTCFVSILITLSDTHALFPFWPHPVTHMLCFHSDQTTHCDTHALFLFWPHTVTHMLCFHSDHTQWHTFCFHSDHTQWHTLFCFHSYHTWWHTCFVSILTTLSDAHALFPFWPHAVTHTKTDLWIVTAVVEVGLTSSTVMPRQWLKPTCIHVDTRVCVTSPQSYRVAGFMTKSVSSFAGKTSEQSGLQ